MRFRHPPTSYQTFCQNGIGIDVRQHREAHADEFFRRFERFDRIGQQITGIGMYLEFDPVRTQRFASHLGGKYSLFGITHSGGIGQQIDPGQTQMFEHIVLRIIQFDPFQCNCHQLAAACCDSLRHHLRRRELARPDKQTGAKLFVSNY